MEEKKKNQWHPGFAAAIRMELRDNRNDLEFETEHNLSRKPLQIDLLIIKNNRNAVMQNKIGRIFRRYNIVEYKSPDDEMGIDTFYKVIAYACLYKANSDREDGNKASDITITLIRHRYPRKLMEYLKEEGCIVKREYPGIYYLTNNRMFKIQIIASKELEDKEHIWLHSLQTNIPKKVYRELLLSIDALDDKEKTEYGDAVLEVVSNANSTMIEKWKEEAEMCATLERIMAPELEEKRLEGKLEGRLEGKLEGRILAYAELGISVEDIADKVSLSVEEVKEILMKEGE